jgi:hypothetical protein
LRARRYVNHALPDGATLIHQRALEQQIAGRIGR